MVSEWIDHGNISEFLKNHGGVNRVQLVSERAVFCGGRRDWLIQLVDAANGLEYMHSIQMVHGDLKGVRFYQLLNNRALITMVRRTSSSTNISVPVSQTSVSQPSSRLSAALQPAPLPWLLVHLSYRSPMVGLLDG